MVIKKTPNIITIDIAIAEILSIVINIRRHMEIENNGKLS